MNAGVDGHVRLNLGWRGECMRPGCSGRRGKWILDDALRQRAAIVDAAGKSVNRQEFSLVLNPAPSFLLCHTSAGGIEKT
ncbi:MAG: hypothetical protein IH977_05600 [Nitrospinae bacterium]|nr:hypothetical protein [Nitrospinota bacterium]